MKTIVAATLALRLAFVPAYAQDTKDAHVAAAKAAAGQDHTSLFNTLCPATPAPAPAPPAAGQRGRGAGGGGGQRGAPAVEQWHAEPVKVFDNLYYVGMTEYSAWAVTTSAGIIVIDTIYDYSIEDEVVNGLKKLGLDPANIKYAIVSHAHVDHHGGAKYLQEKFGTKIVMSEADWTLYENTLPVTNRATRDVIATDGYKLTLGDTTLTLHLTPGHTPGTISTLIPVKDNGQPHLMAEWGGTAFNFTKTPANFQTYIDSAKRFSDIVAKAGADGILSNHTNYDGSKVKMPALATRKPGDKHPYVVGGDVVRRYLKVAEECAIAGKLSL